MDEGYPRSVAEGWAAEGRTAPLPPRFLGARRRRRSRAWTAGRTCSQAIAACPSPTALRTPSSSPPWRRSGAGSATRSTGAARVDAAYADGAATCLIAGRPDHPLRRLHRERRRPGRRGLPAAPGAALHGPARGVRERARGGLRRRRPGRAPVQGRPHRRARTRRHRLGAAGSTSGGASSARCCRAGPSTPRSSGSTARPTCSAATGTCATPVPTTRDVDAGYPRADRRATGAGCAGVDASFVLDGTTYLFGHAGELFRIPRRQEFDWAAHARTSTPGEVPPELRERLARARAHVAADGRGSRAQRPMDGAASTAASASSSRREATRPRGDVRPGRRRPVLRPLLGTRYYTEPDAGLPAAADRRLVEPARHGPGGGTPAIRSVDAVFTGRDDRTYLFSATSSSSSTTGSAGGPRRGACGTDWDSIPFEQVDAAFVGTDGKTYVFSGPQYVRYSSDDYTRVDDRYPAPDRRLLGQRRQPHHPPGTSTPARAIARGAWSSDAPHLPVLRRASTSATTGTAYAHVDDGYPRDARPRSTSEPRFANLTVLARRGSTPRSPTGATSTCSAARSCHVVSDTAVPQLRDLGLRRGRLRVPRGRRGARRGRPRAGTASARWRADVVERTPVRPRALRASPRSFRTGLDAVLDGTDGNTYLFKGRRCYDVAARAGVPARRGRGAARATPSPGRRGVDAAFVGRDGQDLRVQRRPVRHLRRDRPTSAPRSTGDPRPVAEHWGGLTARRAGLRPTTASPTCSSRRTRAATAAYVVVLRAPTTRGPTRATRRWRAPTSGASRRSTGGRRASPRRTPCCSTGRTRCDPAAARSTSQHNAVVRRLVLPAAARPAVAAASPLGTASAPLRTAFTGADGATYFFFRRRVHPLRRRRVLGARADPRRLGADAGTTSRRGPAAGGRRRVRLARGRRPTCSPATSTSATPAPSYRYVDRRLPASRRRRPARRRSASPHLPEAFEDVLADRVAAGEQTVIDAVLANRRTVYLFVGRFLHVVSQAACEATYDLAGLGRVRNTLADTGRVDASFVSGDAHVPVLRRPVRALLRRRVRRSSTRATRAASPSRWPTSSASTSLPEEFRDGIDAAFRGPGDRELPVRGRAVPADRRSARRRPAGRRDLGHGAQPRSSTTPATTARRRVRRPRRGACYAFKGDQYLRYAAPRPSTPTTATRARSRTTGATCPTTFEERARRGVRLRGRHLPVPRRRVRALLRRRLPPVDRTYPQPLRTGGARWRTTGSPTCTSISRFAQLHDRTRTGTAAWPRCSRSASRRRPVRPAGRACSAGTSTSCAGSSGGRRSSAAAPAYEAGVDLEVVAAAVDLFALAAPLGAGTVHGVHGRLDACYGTPTRRPGPPAARPRPRTPCGGWRAPRAGPRPGRSGRRSSGPARRAQRAASATPSSRPCWPSRTDAAHLTRPVRPLSHRRRHGQPAARPRGCARRSPPPSCSSTATCSTCSGPRPGRIRGRRPRRAAPAGGTG